MADRPILFSAPMIRALLAGTKTQTRRICKWMPHASEVDGHLVSSERYSIGDRLWVREQCATWGVGPGPEPVSYPVIYAADDPEWEGIRQEAKVNKDEWKVRSSIHMPRWASRLTLTVTEVRVQRLQEIREADAIAEGIERAKSGRFYDPSMSKGAAAHLGGMHHRAKDAYAALWTSLHGPGSWEANPWVVAVSFEVRKGNIDV